MEQQIFYFNLNESILILQYSRNNNNKKFTKENTTFIMYEKDLLKNYLKNFLHWQFCDLFILY